MSIAKRWIGGIVVNLKMHPAYVVLLFVGSWASAVFDVMLARDVFRFIGAGRASMGDFLVATAADPALSSLLAKLPLGVIALVLVMQLTRFDWLCNCRVRMSSPLHLWTKHCCVAIAVCASVSLLHAACVLLHGMKRYSLSVDFSSSESFFCIVTGMQLDGDPSLFSVFLNSVFDVFVLLLVSSLLYLLLVKWSGKFLFSLVLSLVFLGFCFSRIGLQWILHFGYGAFSVSPVFRIAWSLVLISLLFGLGVVVKGKPEWRESNDCFDRKLH